MIREKIIDCEQKEEYIYAMITLIEKTISIGTILWISILANKLVPTLLFLVSFFELRKRTGGYHANTFLLCYIETIGTYIILLYINFTLVKHILLIYVLLGISMCIILLIGTVNHPNLHMSKKEMAAAKKSSRVLLLLEGSIVCFFGIMDMNGIIISYMASAIIMCAVLLCMAKLLGQEVREYENQ
jgi:accessory gene regulator B